jgi:hypothetical protein
MLSRKIVKVSKTEFEMADGTVHPILFDLEDEPNVEEFQKHYDDWLNVFLEKGLIENGKHETAVNR